MRYSIEPEERLSRVYNTRSLNSYDELLQNLSLFFKATHMLIIRQYFNGIIQDFAVKTLIEDGGNTRV